MMELHDITEMTSNDIQNFFLLTSTLLLFFWRFLCKVYCIPYNKVEFCIEVSLIWSNSDTSWTQYHIALPN